MRRLLVASLLPSSVIAASFSPARSNAPQPRSLPRRLGNFFSSMLEDSRIDYSTLKGRPRSLGFEAGGWALKGEVPVKSEDGYEVATFAGGCFWGTELHFQRLPGVVATCVGYTQGKPSGYGGVQPTYKEVCSGRTAHTEAVLVLFKPSEVSFAALCEKLMSTIDPTLLNQVGRDYGTQYRHGIYPHSPEQMEAARACVARVQAALPPGKRCHTEVVEAQVFWPAEEMHQQYLQKGGRLGSPQSASKGCTDSVRCYG